jgi:hypothetical protein
MHKADPSYSVRVAEPEECRRWHKGERFPSGAPSKFAFVSFRHTYFKLKRNRHPNVRAMSADLEAKYKRLTEEIERLHRERRATINEAWRRADPHPFPPEER